jgi:hypothetical protein
VEKTRVFAWKKPPTCHKSDKLYHITLCRVHLAMGTEIDLTTF